MGMHNMIMLVVGLATIVAVCSAGAAVKERKKEAHYGFRLDLTCASQTPFTRGTESFRNK